MSRHQGRMLRQRVAKRNYYWVKISRAGGYSQRGADLRKTRERGPSPGPRASDAAAGSTIVPSSSSDGRCPRPTSFSVDAAVYDKGEAVPQPGTFDIHSETGHFPRAVEGDAPPPLKLVLWMFVPLRLERPNDNGFRGRSWGRPACVAKRGIL